MPGKATILTINPEALSGAVGIVLHAGLPARIKAIFRLELNVKRM